jgi:lipid A 4'-phosphatase
MTHFPILPSLLARSQSGTAFSNALLAALALAVVSSSWFFYIFPGVDVSVSRWFYDAAEGFVLANSSQLRALRSSATWIMRGVVLLALFQVARHAWTGRMAGQGARRWLWLLSCLVVGPGLLVNGLLKEHWGRPRPRATDVFGGEAPFQKVWVITDWCDRNCSFVSGEASTAAWLVAAALMAPRQIRTAVTTLAAIYAFAISINRIAFGGHYLSDVVLAWLLCALVFTAMSRLILTTNIASVEPMAIRVMDAFRKKTKDKNGSSLTLKAPTKSKFRFTSVRRTPANRLQIDRADVKSGRTVNGRGP